MTFIVGAAPGGGYDTYGRLVARYLSRRLGLSRVVIRNIGGSGIRAANELYAATPDGLTIGTFNTGTVYSQLLGREGVNFDLQQMSWIGKAGGEPRVLTVSRASGFRTLHDVRNAGRPLLLGTNGFGNLGYVDTVLLSHALGLRTRLVFGLSTQDTQLSMMRGEVDGEFGAASSHQGFVRDGNGFFVLRVGYGEGIDDALPDAFELVESEEQRLLIDLVYKVSALLRWTAGPPGIEATRLHKLRDAYSGVLRDPALLADAQRLGIPITPMDGVTLSAAVHDLLDLPPQTEHAVASILRADPATLETAGDRAVPER